jgi:hypothetical protein
MPPETFSLSELLAQYVSERAVRFRGGEEAPDLGGDVLLHDAGPAQQADPRLAWEEALSALKLAGRSAVAGLAPVPEWKALVAAQEPALDLAFCVGNFPQMVRNLNLLLQPGAAPPQRTRPVESAALVAWAEQAGLKPFPQPLLALGALRLAQRFDLAEALVRQRAEAVPAEWRSAWLNEQAALAWHAGRRAEAADLWLTRGDDYLPTLFNRGMAALFEGKPAEARAPLTRAVAGLPEDNSWHHLARLYLALAEMRS